MTTQTLLIDSNSKRCKNIARILSSDFDRVINLDDVRRPVDATAVEEISVVFVHKNDLGFSRESAPQVSENENLAKIFRNAQLVIAYTGGTSGLYTPLLREEAQKEGFIESRWLGINRGISDESNFETEAMHEMVQWSLKGSASDAELPSLLSFQPTLQFTISLLILCQGYLVTGAHNIGLENLSKHKKLAEALLKMGWVTTKESTPEEYCLTPSIANFNVPADTALPGAEYWLAPYKEAVGGGWKLAAGKLKSIVASEWKGELPECIIRLSRCLESHAKNMEAGETVDLDLAAEVFLVFQERLEKKT